MIDRRSPLAKLPLLLPVLSVLPWAASCARAPGDGAAAPAPGVAVLLVDTDRRMGAIDINVYGHFLEHINHSVVDGLDAEQVRGQGFEAEDFTTYWEPIGPQDAVGVADVRFENGQRSVRIEAGASPAGIRQGRVFLQAGMAYDGSAWLRAERGAPQVTFRALSAAGELLAEVELADPGPEWAEAGYA